MQEDGPWEAGPVLAEDGVEAWNWHAGVNSLGAFPTWADAGEGVEHAPHIQLWAEVTSVTNSLEQFLISTGGRLCQGTPDSPCTRGACIPIPNTFHRRTSPWSPVKPPRGSRRHWWAGGS